MPLNVAKAPIAKRVERSPGDKRACTRAFPGIISARKVSPGELLAYANPRPVAEEGAKVNPGGAAETRRNMEPGAALEAQCAIGTATDGFAQVKERAAEPGAAVEGDALAGASTAERMRMLRGCLAMPGPSAFSMKNRLQQYLVSAYRTASCRLYY